ncbi:hypothetical protein ACHAWU_009142 [Discostella pseudostelligera]|uniref:Uncharacterized protein n=1 Tax=Discostella pseudostelligera TaxID=259834 RepID=A0ABD3N2J2_9STRA
MASLGIGRASGSAASHGVARYAASASTSSPVAFPSSATGNVASITATYCSDGKDININRRHNNPHDNYGTIAGNDDQDHTNTIAESIWQPNQTTTIFQKMEMTCPDVMKEYAQCVINKQNSGALTQDACAVQFRAVMECFRSVRISLN